MTYIGYTKSKKIKKLLILSKKIILAHGWNYFFFLVKHEFKKQGFSILSPDSAPQPSFLHENYQSEYIEYLKNIYHNLSKEFQTINNTRSITVIILFDGNNQKLYHTIDSLKKQTHSNWNALILPLTLKSSKNIVEIDTTKIKKLDFTDNDKKLTDSLSSKSDFFCMLKAGNLLDQYALSKILSIHDHDNSDLVYSDHDIIQDGDRTYPFFKPNWSPYLLRSTNFLSPLCIIKAQIFNKIRIESKFLNSIDYDILLKCIEITNKVFHVSLPLCSIEEEDYSKKQLSSHKIVLQNHLNRIKINGTVENGISANSFRVRCKLTSKPKVSILIPTKNNYHMIKRCIDSLEKKTNYSNKEILIIDNDSDCPKVKKYLQNIPYKIIDYKGNFNFSKMNNFAAKQTSGDLLLFLNDDVKAIDSNWLDELVSVCIQDDVGAVGPKLIFSDSTIQHAGMVFLKTGAGFHPGMRLEKETSAYHNIVNLMRDYSAVTGACLLVKKTVFDDVDGFDNNFDVYYGDSDLCLKIINAGFRVIYTPFTELLHEGSDTIQSHHAGASFFDVENHQLFIKKWPYLKNGDPFYNSNLDWDYSISKTPFKIT
jgi:O-antigen biosynthesis protein